MNKIKIATVFSGIGTPEEALKNMGIDFESTFACEIDKYARVTYLENHKAPKKFYPDVTKLDANVHKEDRIDGLVGGFPCQSFSLAGKQLGFEDTRGTLFFDIARVIKESQPNWFVLENVKGLVSNDKPKGGIEIDGTLHKKGYPSKINKEYDGHKKGIGKTLYTIETVLLELGYPSIYWEVVNTKDYGVPQNRERIYIVGFKKVVDFEFAPKVELKLRLKDMLQDNVADKYLLSQKAIDKLNLKKPIRLPSENDVNAMQVGNSKSFGNSTSSNGSSYTLMSSECSGVIENRNNNYIFRKLTPRECFRLQGFDDSFVFPNEEKTLYFQLVYYIINKKETEWNVKLKVAKEKQVQKNLETCVLCTTKEKIKLGQLVKIQQVEMLEQKEKIVNVSFVIEKSVALEQKACATNIIKWTGCTETLFLEIKKRELQEVEVIFEEAMENQSTERLWSVKLTDCLNQEKLYITLILLKQTIISQIYTYAKMHENMPLFIYSSIVLLKDYSKMKLLYLKMVYTKELISSTQLYKQAGNAMSVNILEMVFTQIFKALKKEMKE
jgi:DNA-cytosine methyltransferase